MCGPPPVPSPPCPSPRAPVRRCATSLLGPLVMVYIVRRARSAPAPSAPSPPAGPRPDLAPSARLALGWRRGRGPFNRLPAPRGGGGPAAHPRTLKGPRRGSRQGWCSSLGETGGTPRRGLRAEFKQVSQGPGRRPPLEEALGATGTQTWRGSGSGPCGVGGGVPGAEELTGAGSDLCGLWKQGCPHAPQVGGPPPRCLGRPGPVLRFTHARLRGVKEENSGSAPWFGQRHDGLGISLSSYGTGAGCQGTVCHVCACRPQEGGGRPLTNPGAPWGVQKAGEGAQLVCHPALAKEHLLLHPPQALGSRGETYCTGVPQEEPDLPAGERSGGWALACPLLLP